MTTTRETPAKQPSFLARPEGRIAYDVAGAGPLVLLVPGMGDLRGTYRFLAPALEQAGYRVACVDLRGHGDSDVSFSSYGDKGTAGDIVALIEELGGPAVVVGNSMGAAAAALVAADRPELVLGLVLVGPFLRDPKSSAAQRLLIRAAMARPFAALTWKAYLPRLYAGRRPADFDQYKDSVIESIRKPGYATAFSLTTRTSHAAVEARLAEVEAPALVVMGEKDPDFADPSAEARWIAERLGADVVMVPEAGHYPQSQRPDVAAEAVLGFLKTVTALA
jgi:pimeloyl-ACP methyl ester carboxylesterase